MVGCCANGSASLTSAKAGGEGGKFIEQQRDHQHDESGLQGHDTVSLNQPAMAFQRNVGKYYQSDMASHTEDLWKYGD